MQRVKKISFLVFLLASFNAKAELSLRKCLLLPITDSIGGDVSFQVFQSVERYLKNGNWCYYKPNSEIINILANYKSNLHHHLNNPDVVKLIAARVTTGSIIRIRLDNQIKNTEINLSVIGENGKDLYFKEKATIPSRDPLQITEVIKKLACGLRENNSI